MFRALNINNDWVSSVEAKTDGAYFCPVCHEMLIVILNSPCVTDHFRHHPKSKCTYGESEESDAHKQHKVDLLAALQRRLGTVNASDEETLPDGQRADIFFEVAGQGVAVELQYSHISDQELVDRCYSYTDKGIASIWMPGGIQRFLNAVDEDLMTGRSLLPLWMRRIARLTDNVAFDRLCDEKAPADVLIGIGLDLIDRQMAGPDGIWRNYRFFPTAQHVLSSGTTRLDTDDNRYRRLMWLPQRVKGLAPQQKKRKKMERRDAIVDHSDANDCYREPTNDLEEYLLYGRRPTTIYASAMRQKYDRWLKPWEMNAETMPFAERCRLMGFK